MQRVGHEPDLPDGCIVQAAARQPCALGPIIAALNTVRRNAPASGGTGHDSDEPDENAETGPGAVQHSQRVDGRQRPRATPPVRNRGFVIRNCRRRGAPHGADVTLGRDRRTGSQCSQT